MKNKCSLVLAGLMLSACLCGSAYAQNIAVVDVPAVVAKSAQVQALKKEQETKVKELEKWLQTAKADVEKQQTEAGKEKLLKKYNDDFAKKRETIAKNYQTKLQAIDKSISDTIAATAKAKGYDMVISKGTVLYGGDDITADIQKVVK
ncbi:OmpH family outer membrane protein [bacterium]|nr:OmpH family outer membrane protein [bacterium]